MSPKPCHPLAMKPWPKHLHHLVSLFCHLQRDFFLKFMRDLTFYRCTYLNASSPKHLSYSVMNIKVLVTLKLHFTISYFYPNWTTKETVVTITQSSLQSSLFSLPSFLTFSLLIFWYRYMWDIGIVRKK